MALHNIEYNLQSDNRTGIRIEVAKLFTLEEPGIGKGENCSKYHYIVEHLVNIQLFSKDQQV